jgi:hypothetical protein
MDYLDLPTRQALIDLCRRWQIAELAELFGRARCARAGETWSPMAA